MWVFFSLITTGLQATIIIALEISQVLLNYMQINTFRRAFEASESGFDKDTISLIEQYFIL